MRPLISVGEFKCQVCDEKEKEVLLKRVRLIIIYYLQSSQKMFEHVFLPCLILPPQKSPRWAHLETLQYS